MVAGEPYRLMTRQDWPYCVACVRLTLGEDPPADLPPPARPPDLRVTASRFNRDQVAATVRALELDYRAKRAGGEGDL